MAWHLLLGFALAVLPMVMTPGASFLLTTTRQLQGDRHGARLTILGTAAGIVTHAVLAGIGLSALVMRSAEAFQVVRLVGAAYLIGLGVLTLRRGIGSRRPAPGDETGQPPGSPLRAAYLANVLNPKAATVYLALAPQFIAAQQVGVGPMVALALVHVALMAGWLELWGVGFASGLRRLDRAALRRWTDRVGGAILVGLGVRTAVS